VICPSLAACARSSHLGVRRRERVINLSSSSIGEALIDTIDDLINDGRIEPQLAMKILSNFDRAIAETLAEKVKSRLTFKVRISKSRGKSHRY
jgi:hypothetical protein